MLKTLIGAGHAEFAGLKQQDAQEFLLWLLSRIQREGKPSGRVERSLLDMERNRMKDMGDVEYGMKVAENGCQGWGGYVDPTRCFKFGMQQRIQCLGCGGVKYSMTEQDNINIIVPERLK
jgi:ubiquitin carboxyl-terminal hydrolase 5/13